MPRRKTPEPPVELVQLSRAAGNGDAAFYAVANALPHLVWLSSAGGAIDFFNERWIDYTGYNPIGTQARGYDQVVHPDDLPLTLERWQTALRTGDAYEMEYRLRRARDGIFRWFLARAIPLHGPDGRIRRWIGTATDIEAQKRANENLIFGLQSADVFASAQSEEEISDAFSRLIVERFADWCFIILENREHRFFLQSIAHRDPKKVETVRSFAERYPLSDDNGLRALLDRNEAVFHPAISDEMLTASARNEEHLSLMRSLGMHSCIVTPLGVHGRPFGAVVVYTADSHREFDPGDVQVLRSVTDRAGAAIARERSNSHERRAKVVLRFISRATQAIYESFDLYATFQELTRLVADNFADFAVVARIESGGAVRALAAAHRDASKEELVRKLIGSRPFHPEAERKFAEGLRSHQPAVRKLDGALVARSMWPYLATEIEALAPTQSVTIPLHSRGETYGAIVVYASLFSARMQS